MKTVLCYGDSNTWGYAPPNGTRLPYAQRWTGILQDKFRNELLVVEEGMNGRTTSLDEPDKEGRNGLSLIQPLIETHAPIDLVIVMLGTNDLKRFFHSTTEATAKGIEAIVKKIKSSDCGPHDRSPEVLVIAPPNLGALNTDMMVHFEGATERSKALPKHLEDVAKRNGVHYLDSNQVASSNADGVHLDKQGHSALAEKLSEIINVLLELGAL